MSELHDIIGSFVDAGVKFAVVGGVAMQLHGSTYLTFDIDFVYERSRENAERIVTAMKRFSPRPRGFPADLPFIFDVQTLMVTEILTLETTAGDVDLIADLKAVGRYSAVLSASEEFEVDGLSFRVLSIDGLIAAKEAAGRPKDIAGVIELRALKELIEK